MILEQFSQDIRVGVRVLLKDKLFLILSVLVLALGIGGAMTQFTVVNAIVLRGFSFPHPEELVSTHTNHRATSGEAKGIPEARGQED